MAGMQGTLSYFGLRWSYSFSLLNEHSVPAHYSEGPLFRMTAIPKIPYAG